MYGKKRKPPEGDICKIRSAKYDPRWKNSTENDVLIIIRVVIVVIITVMTIVSIVLLSGMEGDEGRGNEMRVLCVTRGSHLAIGHAKNV